MEFPQTKNALHVLKSTQIRFSICTMVTRPDQYEEMLSSFRRHGFNDAGDCEFIFIDNTASNALDAYAALNVFFRTARGQYVIFCHQDIELIEEGKLELLGRLDELERLDPMWALAGNAGGRYLGDMDDLAIRITDPHGANQNRGPFPQRVTALDENFIVAKASANLAASGDLKGFHCYGMDLAVIADVLGYNTYVIDFHLRHKSAGKVASRQSLRPGEVHFSDARSALKAKYSERFSPRWLSSPTATVLIAPRYLRNAVYNLRLLLVDTWRALRSRRRPE